MAERSISVKLLAEVGNYLQGFQRAKAATSDLIDEMAKSEQARSQFQQLGTGLTVAGAAIAGGLGLATKAAIDWETAWAGVVKTVDGSEAQLAALEDDLRSMTAELPASHAEIAAVAEAAGQLGIAVDDVAVFTRTMIDMGEATNLTAEEAAVAIAQMANVMGTSVSDVGRLGAAVVDLGNSSATTEADIVSMAQRIAGAGATIGLSEADVLGFSAALASVGINAEAGGSAISRAMIQIESRVRAGGTELEDLARVAGMTADEFRQAYEQDAAQAITSFIAGLGRMQAQGQDVFATLDQLGFSEIRLRDALLRLASSGDLVTRSLETSARAWDENLALTEEAERRYETAAARVEMARNQINEFAIEMGAIFLPVVAETADAVAGFTGWLADLPDPIKSTVGIVAALVGGLALLSGTLLLGVTRLAAYKASLDQLAASGGRAAVAVGRLRSAVRLAGIALGPVTAALIAIEAASTGLSNVLSSDLNPQIDAMVTGLRRLEETGEVSGELLRVMEGQVGGVSREMERLLSDHWWDKAAIGVQDFMSSLPGFSDSMFRLVHDLEEPRQQIEALDQALATLARESPDQAEAAFALLASQMGLTEKQAANLRDQLDEWKAAAEVGAEQARDTADGISEIADTADDAADKIDAMREAFDRLFGIQMSLDRATLNYQETMADLIEELEDGALKLDVQSEAGRANRRAVLDQIDAIADLRQANIDAGMSVDEANEKYRQQIRDLEDLLVQMGLDEEQVHELISAYESIPAQVKTEVEATGTETAIERVRRLRREIEALTGKTVHIGVTGGGVGAGGGFQERHGGITIPAQRGLLRRAAIFSPAAPARFAFAEPATGGEAFIPRIGDRARSLAIADEAARWHGGRVVVDGPFQWRAARPVTPPAGTTTGDGAPEVRVFIGDRELTDIVKVEIRSHDRQLRRAVTAGSGGML